MLRENIDRGWEFMNGKPSSMPGREQPTRTVNLPHDFIVETDTFPEAPGGAEAGYYGGGIGTYTKLLEIPEDYFMEKKRTIVEFDGSYMNTTVSLNGHVVDRHHYGYTPFHVDITKYLKAGRKNRLEVCVNNEAQPNGRWYSGGGLYRHVDLLTGPNLHIAPWGIFAYTNHVVNGIAAVVTETLVENHTGEDADIWVAVCFIQDTEKREAARDRVKVHVPAGESRIARIQMAIPEADIWDIDDPKLYQIRAELTDGEQVLDAEETLFGIRTISVDTRNGFLLNGRKLKLKGGCVHHDNGILGSASYFDSEYRKMMIHKKNGYNAIRFSHNPMSRDLLEACDRVGLLVMNEAFDTWTIEKNTHDYSNYFQEEWERVLTNFIKRDRNHPCVIMWSIGNEIPERGGLSDGYHWSAKLSEGVRKLDSTRFVTSALCSFFNGLDDEDRGKFWQALYEESRNSLGGGVLNLDNSFGKGIWNSYTEEYCAPLDVVGYNYLNYHYEKAAQLFPNRVICCTESKPGEMEEYWADVEKYPHVIGDFIWTSHDYLGEAGIGKLIYVEPGEEQKAAMSMYVTEYPWRAANSGDFDICGLEKPQSAFHRIVWGSKETYIASFHPANHEKREVKGRYAWGECENIWTYPGQEGKPVRVEVYSNAEEVELFLNGKSLGREKTGKENHRKAVFEITYEQGELEAISYSGKEKVSSDCVRTAKEAAALRMIPDKKELKADGQSLCYVWIEVVDAEGNVVPYFEQKATATVEGMGVLAAFGTGRPKTDENYTKGEITSYKGKMLAIIRSGYEEGTILLEVNMEGLTAANLEIPVKILAY